VTVPLTAVTRFIRLVNPAVGGTAPVIQSVTLEGGSLVIRYGAP